MAGAAWKQEEIDLLGQLAKSASTVEEIASRLNRSVAAVRNKMKRDGIRLVVAGNYQESFSHDVIGDNEATIVSVSREIKTADDACRYGEVDLSIWEVAKHRVSSSETAIKMPDGSVKVVPLWHIRVELKRRFPKKIGNAIEAFAERIRKHSPSIPARKETARKKEMLFEFSAFDAHFGKRCWGEETGTNYDTGIAERIFSNAVDELISRVQNYQIGKVVFPIGQDFFNVDNWSDTTHNGTPQDTDDRFQKVFVAGLMSLISATEKFLKIAPVEVLWVPGNHDMTTSWYLANCMKERFHSTKHITVDVSPPVRKYLQWGNTMLMFLHGDNERESDLGSIAATEQPHMWAATTWREAHCGHFHKKRELKSVDIDEHHGFRVRRLPSLSGTDRWHHRKGYVGSNRCAEGYIFSDQYGFVSMHNAIAKP